MIGTFVGKYIGCNRREYNGKPYYSFSVLQDGMSATRVDCPEEVYYNVKDLKELTVLVFAATIYANAKSDRAWITLKVTDKDSVRLYDKKEEVQNGGSSVSG